MMLSLFFSIVVINILGAIAQCHFNLNGNVSFDLSPLARSSQSYESLISRQDEQHHIY